jgi:outer membrane immunogenic protein
MFRRLLLATAAMAVLAAPAFAEDTFNWHGLYAGINGGYGGDHFGYPAALDLTSGTDTIVANATGHVTSSGFLGGGQLGYNYVFPSGWLIGGEADADIADIRGRIGGFGTLSGVANGSATLAVGSKLDYLGTVRARVGYILPHDLLAYATAGMAYGGVTSNAQIGVSSTTAPIFSAAITQTQTDIGWTVGAGVEYPVCEHVTLRTEYLYVNLGTHSLLAGPISALGFTGTGSLEVETSAHILRVGLNYMLN